MKYICMIALMLSQIFADDLSNNEAQYGMVVDFTQQVADEFKVKLEKKQLNESEIYTMLSSLVAYDTRIWSAALAFTPSFIDDLVASDWSGFDQPWHFYQLGDGKKLYAPYVWRASNNVLHADNIANQKSKFGYDYTSGQWAWWSQSMASGKPMWMKPVYSNLTGDRMVTYSFPINREAVLIFNVYYGV